MSQPRDEVASESPAMTRALQQLSDRALDKLPVLLLGESGVGKRRLARWLHQKSLEAASALVICQLVDEPEDVCDEALTAKLAQAEGGAIFIDEIGELPKSAQQKILTALSQHRLRLIASSREDVSSLKAKEKMLPGLLQALGEPILIPSLRERKEDFSSLLGSFLLELGLPEDAVAPAAKEALLQYGWPENVRELKHTVIRVIRANGGVKIKFEHLPPRFHPSDHT
jgi:DNA-binding NtrC family response regulator